MMISKFVHIDETVKQEEVRDRMELDGERKLGAGHSGHPVQ